MRQHGGFLYAANTAAKALQGIPWGTEGTPVFTKAYQSSLKRVPEKEAGILYLLF